MIGGYFHMKFGVRKPSLKKSFKARTTGKMKLQIKRAIDPTYGKKGMGWIKDPKKAAYNKVYNKTTVGCLVPLVVYAFLILALLGLLF